jgi:hypothetical protein
MTRSSLLLFALLAVTTACTSLQINRPIYEITTTKPDDKLSYTWQDETAYFYLYSPGGIGQAQFRRTGGAVPHHIIFNVFLKGLESFRLTYGQTAVQVSLRAVDAPILVQSGPPGGALQDVTSDASPLWMPVRIVASMPTIPMTNGYFEITAPPVFISDNPQSFSIEWIDFYR